MRAAGSALVCLLLSSSVFAGQSADDFRPISDFHRTRWATEEGAPGDTWAIAQTADGWLWLGGPQGLFRFDGVEFESVPSEGGDPKQSGAVYTLFAEEAGDLWVGHLYGGVTHIRNGSIRRYGAGDGLPLATILSLARDADGVLWAASSAGLWSFDGKRWQSEGAETGFTDPLSLALELDGGGALWAMGSTHFFRRPPHESRFERTDQLVRSQASYFLRSADGSLWCDDGSGVYRLPDQAAVAPRPAHANSRRPHAALFDREGHLWAGAERGIARIRVPTDAMQIRLADAMVTRLDEKEDRADESVTAMLEDQEGNIWVATRGGLERFRHTNIRRLDLGRGNANGHALAAGDGVLWIGQDTGGYRADLDGLWRFDGRLTHVAPELIRNVTAAGRDGSGTFWFAGAQGVWRRESNGSFTRLPDLPSEAAGRIVQSLTVDSEGQPWVSVLQGGLHQFSGGRWQLNGGIAGLPNDRLVSQARDPNGHLWIGYRQNQIARIRADHVTVYGEQQGLQLGVIVAIHAGRFTIIAGEKAIALFDGQRFHSVTAAEDTSALEGVTGIAEALDGDLWLNGIRGAVRIAHRDLEEAGRIGRYTVPVEVFDVRDGYPGFAQRVRPLPTLVRDENGRLWFAGTFGVGWLHPDDVRRNSIPPPIHFRSLVSGENTYVIADSVKLPVGAHDLEIKYTALSLSRPERVRFRYRLEGYDDTWVEAGSRRQAFYTNLAPGSYRFQVIAANESGVWNESGASVGLTIPPTFVQTRTFLALCVLAGALLVWGFMLVRVNQLTARERSRLGERLSERERIARELHDTLLQGVHGLILKLQTTVDQANVPSEARASMNDALDRADCLLAEGRDRVKDLRNISTVPQSLKQVLLDAAEHLSVDQHARLRILEDGAPRELHPIVREESARIAIEAILNALRHADAGSIEVELSYGRRALRVIVKDDGRGMEASMVSDGREGHFGFMGMKERAKRIRGQLGIWSRPGAGTEVNLSVPARMAYVSDTWKRRLARLLNRSTP